MYHKRGTFIPGDTPNQNLQSRVGKILPRLSYMGSQRPKLLLYISLPYMYLGHVKTKCEQVLVLVVQQLFGGDKWETFRPLSKSPTFSVGIPPFFFTIFLRKIIMNSFQCGVLIEDQFSMKANAPWTTTYQSLLLFTCFYLIMSLFLVCLFCTKLQADQS